jgi:hypothetical protein
VEVNCTEPSPSVGVPYICILVYWRTTRNGKKQGWKIKSYENYRQDAATLDKMTFSRTALRKFV